MAFQYISGAEISIANWFATFEAWITGTVGWSVSSGSGTTDLVITSSGEDGLRTKLFVNLDQQVSPNSFIIYGQVQDDAPGTHKTTSNAYLYAYVNESTPELFDYWMSADLDSIAIVFRRSSDAYYTSVYLGLVIPFAKALGGDEYMMVACRTNSTGAVLRNYDGTWNVGVNTYQEWSANIDDPTELDDFAYLAVPRIGTNNSVVGQPKHVSSGIAINEIGFRDTIETGPAGAKTNWIALGYSGTTAKFALRTGGVESMGTDDEAGFKHLSGLTNSMADWFTTLEDWMVNTVGWTVESGSGTQDIVFSSIGESGSDNVFIRVSYVGSTMSLYAYDDAAGSNRTSASSQIIRSYDFPTQYYMSADKDCLCFTFNIVGDYSQSWVGKFRPFNPNLPDTPRSMATLAFSGTATVYNKVLRRHDIAGTWNVSLSRVEITGDITPSLFDLNTHIMWPIMFYNLSAYGTPKYIYRTRGAISIMDTIQSGNRVYRVFRQASTTNPYWCMRVQ